MNLISCPHEKSVTEAARTGRWDSLLKAHIQECAHCREIAGIAEWLGNAARYEKRMCVPPDAAYIWLNARILAVQRKREHAIRPLAFVELIVGLILILALTAGIAWIWSAFQSITFNWLLFNLSVPQPVVISVAALAICLGTLLCLKFAQTLFVED